MCPQMANGQVQIRSEVPPHGQRPSTNQIRSSPNHHSATRQRCRGIANGGHHSDSSLHSLPKFCPLVIVIRHCPWPSWLKYIYRGFRRSPALRAVVYQLDDMTRKTPSVISTGGRPISKASTRPSPSSCSRAGNTDVWNNMIMAILDSSVAILA